MIIVTCKKTDDHLMLLSMLLVLLTIVSQVFHMRLTQIKVKLPPVLRYLHLCMYQVQAGPEESHGTSEPQRLTNRKKSGRERALLANSLVPSTTIRPHQTQSHVAQAKAPAPEEVRWTGPPRKSPLSAIHCETLDLPTREVET